WYSKGLHFKCIAPECTDCCSGSRGPGYVWVTADDMENMAKLLKMDFDVFTRKYIRQINWSFSLIETPSHDCVFLGESGCTVYDARPGQCRTYPFWAENVETPKAWRKEAALCPGINDDAPVIPAHEIDKQLELDAKHREAYDES
ncbi:YkgJ family cysteine cluster protein, partial [Planctomycetota bacterium]|nr:YkgJ family cysteine cluster protein [Planctomycetota bacterium]